jgi:predicted ATPase
LDNREYEYRVEIRFEPETKELSVSQERLKVSGALVFERVAEKVSSPPGGAQASSTALDSTVSALPQFQSSNLHVGRFIEWMTSLHCFRIDEYPDAMDDRADREEREPDYEFKNLAAWYRFANHNYREQNDRFLSSIREALNGFQTLRFSSDEDGIQRLRCDFVGPLRERTSYAISELSEGQRCLVVLYMILDFLLARGDTVFIDEPDNFIALREIQPWLLAAEAAVDDYDGQLILISHHPELLDQWASTYGVRFFREDNGHVRTEKFKPDPAGNLHPSELIARGWENE